MSDMQDRILDLAKKRFERFGYQKTTMDEICRDGLISKKTVYRVFRDKQDLFEHVLLRESTVAREEIFRRLGKIPDPVTRLKRLVDVALDYFKEERFLGTLLKDEDRLFLPFISSQHVARAEEEVMDLIIEILREGMREGKIRNVDEQIVAYIMLKIFQAFTFARTGSLPMDQATEDKEKKILSDFLLRALRKQP